MFLVGIAESQLMPATPSADVSDILHVTGFVAIVEFSSIVTVFVVIFEEY